MTSGCLLLAGNPAVRNKNSLLIHIVMWGIDKEDVYRELDQGWKSSRKIVEEIQEEKGKVRDPFVTGEILAELYNMRERGHAEARQKGIFRRRFEYRLTPAGSVVKAENKYF